MNYKHSSVVDADGYYVDFVLVVETDTFYEDGAIATEWVVQNYTLQDGEYLVDTPRPHGRVHADDDGIVRFKWDGKQWVEGATAEEIAQWGIDNPAPEVIEPVDPMKNAIEEGLTVD